MSNNNGAWIGVDLDGTLAESKRPLSEDMAATLARLLAVTDVAHLRDRWVMRAAGTMRDDAALVLAQVVRDVPDEVPPRCCRGVPVQVRGQGATGVYIRRRIRE